MVKKGESVLKGKAVPTWKELGYSSYQQYRDKDPYWIKFVKKNITNNPKARCWICGKDKQLIGHHENYENLGKEKLHQDVEVLCWTCHTLAHFRLVLRDLQLFPYALVPRTLKRRRLFLRAVNEWGKGKYKLGWWFFMQSLMYGL